MHLSLAVKAQDLEADAGGSAGLNFMQVAEKVEPSPAPPIVQLSLGQDSKPSTGPGMGVTKKTDWTGSTAGAARNRGALMKGSPHRCGEGRGGSGRGALRLGKTTSYKTNAITQCVERVSRDRRRSKS